MGVALARFIIPIHNNGCGFNEIHESLCLTVGVALTRFIMPIYNNGWVRDSLLIMAVVLTRFIIWVWL